MSADGIDAIGLERLLKSIDRSNRSTSESIAEIKDYMIHNDYRHAATEAKIEVLSTDFSIMLEMMEARSSMWRAFKKGRWIVGLISAGILTAAGTGVYNYIAKPDPAIHQNKELTVKSIKVVK